MQEANNNTTANNNVANKTVKIVPNAESWRYINVGNTFTNCLNILKDCNSKQILENIRTIAVLSENAKKSAKTVRRYFTLQVKKLEIDQSQSSISNF